MLPDRYSVYFFNGSKANRYSIGFDASHAEKRSGDILVWFPQDPLASTITG